MENVDEIILHQLRSIGIEFDEGVQSLRDLSTDAVFRSISACLRAISGQQDVPRTLPPSMSLRYSACGKLAEMIKSLGYRGDIGYQTILYCSETDMRSVLAFLIERLPREQAEVQQTSKFSYQDAVLKAICSELASQLNRPWIPARYRALVEENRKTDVETVPLLDSFLSKQQQQKSIMAQAGNRPAVLAASLVDAVALAKAMEARSSVLPAGKHNNELEHFKIEVKAAVQAAALMAKIAGKTAGKAPKPSPRKSKAGEPGAGEGTVEKSAEEEERERKEKAEQLRGELQRLKEELNALLTDTANLGRRRGELEGEIEALNGEIERTQGEIASRELVASLLPNAAENVEKLQQSINSRRSKIDTLRQQWLELKGQLEAQLDKLTGAAELEERRQLEKRLETAERERESILGEMPAKEEAIKSLEAELEKAPNRDVTRSTYTKRIIDMIGNTKKQKTEIQKIAADTRLIQKEMNSMGEKVDRAFHIADEMVFRDSKRDESARKMYRLLVAMHQDFAATTAALDETASQNRELDDLETKVDTETRKGWEERADKIRADIAAMRQEQQ